MLRYEMLYYKLYPESLFTSSTEKLKV